MPDGRFAPSPTGPLHVGNLRTALLAWLFARASGSRFFVRMEDLDRVTSSPENEQQQLDDLAAFGIDWDGDVIRQSTRFAVHRAAISGYGIACLSHLLVEDDIQSGRLCRLLPNHQCRQPLFVAYASRRRIPHRTRAVIDFLCELIQDDPHMRL